MIAGTITPIGVSLTLLCAAINSSGLMIANAISAIASSIGIAVKIISTLSRFILPPPHLTALQSPLWRYGPDGQPARRVYVDRRRSVSLRRPSGDRRPVPRRIA